MAAKRVVHFFPQRFGEKSEKIIIGNYKVLTIRDENINGFTESSVTHLSSAFF